MERLTVRDASRHFGRVPALENVGLALQAGEWIGLVGPNGAGKTTLVRVLCGLERLDHGVIAMDGGTARARLRPVDRRRIGFVPQDVALYALLSARENLRCFGRLNGLRGAALEDRIRWALAWTALKSRADDPVRTLSGGMKRCLNIACSVLHRPDVVLLDEPTVGVDAEGRERIGHMLQSLREDGTSLIQSSHQLREVQASCDRILVMFRGRILASLRPNGEGGDSYRTVRLTIDREAPELDLGARFTIRGRSVVGPLGNVARDLPALLMRLGAHGVEVTDLQVEGPQLEDALARLTGTGSSP